MPKYTVPLSGWANIAVTVETDEADPEKIAELAQMAAGVSLCHQCADSRNDSLEIGDEWEPLIDERTGKPEVTKEGD